MPGFAAVALDGVYMSSLGSFIDAYVLVRHQIVQSFHLRQAFTMETPVYLLTPDGRPFTMAGGRRMPADAGLDTQHRYDLVHVPGFKVDSEKALAARLSNAGPLCEWLVAQHTMGALISASGSGVFVLAESGLLDGGIVTMSRPLIPLFRLRFPYIRLDRSQPVIENGRVITGSGLAADAKLMTRLVEYTTTPALARWLSDVTGLHQDIEEQISDDPLVANAQLWIEERFAQNVNIADLARAMSVSQQTLLRHFHQHLDTTPRDYIRQTRVEAAKRMLQRTSRTVEEIASLVGYNDIHSFRKVFRQATGTSPSRFRTANNPAARGRNREAQ